MRGVSVGFFWVFWYVCVGRGVEDGDFVERVFVCFLGKDG